MLAAAVCIIWRTAPARRAALITFEEIVRDQGYPGFNPEEHFSAPWATERLSLFTPQDADRFWFIGFQWPRAYPLNMVWLEDGFAWATQWAAQGLPLPAGNGLVPRIAGIHVYGSDISVSKWVQASRGERVAETLPAFLRDFTSIWSSRKAELLRGLSYFERAPLADQPLADVTQYLEDARRFHARAWEIHFEVMYPLIANYLGFYGLCRELQLPPENLPKFLQGFESQPMRSDRAMWSLVNEARGTPVGQAILSSLPGAIRATLEKSAAAASWLAQFESFLGEYGWRADRVVDISSASWSEQPDIPLGIIQGLLQSDNPYAFEDRHRAAVAERERAIEEARSRLTRAQQEPFDQALQSCQNANFAWWNEDHNWYIDMRCTLPLRRAALELGRRLELEDPEDVLFLFYSELRALAHGSEKINAFIPLIRDRKDYFRHWDSKRQEMPKVLGRVPENVTDPVLIEIFGITTEFLATMKRGVRKLTQLSGIAASPGVATGRARVLRSPDEIQGLKSGDVLVCEGTTPTWTPAFTKIAGCVCDAGGTLTHASIVSREYGVPCVVGVGLATQTILDGDEITVDGTRGIVKIHSRS
jgi:phosphohistidine swiveling domain-containing protein